MMLTAHFSFEEMTISQTATRRGLSNIPSPEIAARLALTCAGLEDVRETLGGAAMHIDSGYRAPLVNRAVGGSPTSSHMEGWAADFIAPGYGSPLAICHAIAASSLRFDQLIEEGTWVHIAFAPRLRRMIETKRAGGGYQLGLRPL